MPGSVLTRALIVLSTGRCGSLTLMRLIGSSGEFRAYHEPPPTFEEEAQNAYVDGGTADYYKGVYLGARLAYLQHAIQSDSVYAEATSMRTLAPAIKAVLPKAKFIHLYRHPGGVVRSGMCRGWYAGHALDPWRLRPKEDDPIHTAWYDLDPFGRCCWYWHAMNRFILDFLDRMSDWAHPMYFEELIDAGTGEYRIPFSLFDIEPPPKDKVIREIELKTNKSESSAFPKYEDWTTARRDTLYAIAGDTMVRLGYK
jgi:hypothetical protein